MLHLEIELGTSGTEVCAVTGCADPGLYDVTV